MALQRSVALSGPMGAGKSTVARIVAERLGLPLVDLDAHLEQTTGRTVASLFATEGEAAFRTREREAIAALVSASPRVVSLGGGSVVDPRTRRSLLEATILVTLDAKVDTLVARLGADEIAKRPLLAATDPRARLEEIVRARSDAYAESHARIAVDALSPERVAEEVIAIAERDPVAVALGPRSYRVEVGSGRFSQLNPALAALGGRSLLVTDDRVASLVDLSSFPHRVVLPHGEAHKTIESVAAIWDGALGAQLDRSGVLVAVGGGVIGDLTGFAAATYMRGVRFVQVPTTLLSMVDASVGGKTAIDRPQGKNLVGAFHQPSLVIADVDHLATLPDRELRSGLAEVAKTALLFDESFVERLERDASRLLQRDRDALTHVVRTTIAHKARIVAEDEHDLTGRRAVLNLGHTLGHALETEGGYSRLTHGEAVALGMVAALRIGVALGVTEGALLDRTVALLRALGLPHALDSEMLRASLAHVGRDKKREGAAIAFILLPEIGKPRVQRIAIDQLAGHLGLA